MRPVDLPESNHYKSKDQELLTKEYEYLFSICTINGNKKLEVEKICKKILLNKNKYVAVEEKIGTPWYFVAAIHCREASLNFNTYLGNGDPLNKVSVHVPKGRGPFPTWEAGAIDALNFEGYSNLKDWSLGATFRRMEGYNGWGYRTGRLQGTTPLNASPYIYGFTPFYQKGRAIEDHSWYPDSADNNAGCMAILKQLEIMGETLFAYERPAVKKTDKEAALALAAELGQKVQLQKLFDYAAASKANFWAVVDFNKSSSLERLYIFNLKGQQVRKFLVAHGEGSGLGYAIVFSNVAGSHCSSLGTYKTLATYIGAHGESLRIEGLEATNSNAHNRSIVIHSADYVVPDYKNTGRSGRSEGCFAVNPKDIKEVIECLRDGSHFMAWHS